ncbi:hypothetical protein [Nocardia nepalensis]|uniref:hypothetical protein n=1 Tax=Nocardia nepalensis TaxID=3375448 RepID=UPI003B66D158
MTPTTLSGGRVIHPSPPSSIATKRQWWRLLWALAVIATILGSGTAIAAADPVVTPTQPAPSQPPTVWQTTPPAPTPVTPTPARPGDPTGPGNGGSEDPECGVRHISGCVAKAIDGFFQRLVDSALNPLLDLLSQTLLTTPEPQSLPRVGELWQSSWQLVLACYGLIVVAAGVLLMTYELLQTHWTLRELAPRLAVGFIAGAVSMLIATKAIALANTLTTAIGGDGLDPDSAGAALKHLAVTSSGSGGIFTVLLANVLVVMVTVLLVTYVVRVIVTIVLVVAAPLALMCHGLPQLESIAWWWWRAMCACLAIQVVQSMVLITAARVFLSPGDETGFLGLKGPMVNLIVGLALMGILVKTPFWLLSALRIGHGRSMIGSLARGFIAYKTFGLLSGRSSRPGPRRTPSGRGQASPTAAGDPDPYARVRSTRDGQLMLPLSGVRRIKQTRSQQPQPNTAPAASSALQPKQQPKQRRGRQLTLPLWPREPAPLVGRDGQYRLPITVARVPSARRAKPPTPPAPSHRGQLAFDFDPDPYRGNRPTRSGQYPLPLEVRRVPARPPTAPTSPHAAAPVGSPPPPPPPRQPRRAGQQLLLPFPNLPIKPRARRSGGSKK